MAIQKAQRGNGEPVWSLKTSMSNGRMDRGPSRNEWYGPAPGGIPVKPCYQALARRLGIEGTVLPNAKSVSETLCQRSHRMKPPPPHISGKRCSPALQYRSLRRTTSSPKPTAVLDRCDIIPKKITRNQPYAPLPLTKSARCDTSSMVWGKRGNDRHTLAKGYTSSL